MALSGIPIDPQQCIGDSLVVLNNSFIELDSRSLALSSNQTSLSASFASLSASIATINQSLTSTVNTNYSKLKFTATGATDYSVSSLIGSQTNAFLYRVDINGVVQEPGTNVTNGDYYLSGGNLWFSSAPSTGTKILIVGPIYT